MIRQCDDRDVEAVYNIINDAAIAYRGVIPADCWHEPYMSREYLGKELGAGVLFWGYEESGCLAGVIGLQQVREVTLIRHAYVRASRRNKGIGGMLLSFLKTLTSRPVLVGTWQAADWAVGFYEKHGFRLVGTEEKDRLLRTYWSIPDRQIETSVVLADQKWWNA